MNSSRRRIGLSKNRKSKTSLHGNSEEIWAGDTEFLSLNISEVNKPKTYASAAEKRKLQELSNAGSSSSKESPPKKQKLSERHSDPTGLSRKFESPKGKLDKSAKSLNNFDKFFNDSFMFDLPLDIPAEPPKTPDEEEVILSSQKFIEEIGQIPKNDWARPNSNLEEDPNIIITKNEEICSQYFEIPREDPKNESLDDLFLDLDQNSLNENIDSLESSMLETDKNDQLNITVIKKIDWDKDDFSILAQKTPVAPSTSHPKVSENPETPLTTPKTTKRTPKVSKELIDALFPSQPMTPHERFSKRQKLMNLRPVSSSKFSDIGPFFGLPVKVSNLIKEHKGIENLYDWQCECLNLKAVNQRNNLIYALPTSGGKSLVSEILMIREIMLRRKNVMLVLPYVSLVQEKITDLTPFALELGYLVEEYAAGKGSIPPLKRKNKNCIFVCTIEKSLILFDSLYELNRAGEVGLVVVDELHMVGDSHRGYVLETLLSKMMFLTDEIQIVGMSATIANLNEIAMFLKADLYTKQFRPVELKEYVKFGKDLMEVKDNAEHIKDAFVLARTLEVSYDRKMQQRDPDHLMALVYEVIPKESCLVFCPTKQNCESVALLLVEMLPKELQQHRKDEKIELMNAIKLDSGGTLCNVLVKTIPFGVAYHHSGLTAEERKHIEDAYRLGIICALCCTSTLAAGVNLPAKRVIIRSPYTGPEFLTKSRYKQMVGRAGRAGHAAAGESIMICGPNDNSKIARLFCSPMDEVTSGFLTDESRIFLQTVIMNCIDNEVASNFSRLLEFFELTLMGIQSQKFQVEIYEEVKNGLKVLFRNGAVAIQINEDQRDTRSLDITQSSQRKLELNYFDHLSVSQLGKGAVKAGISLEKASQLYKHLQTAQKSFDLSNYLHLLYLVTPDDAVAAIKPNFRIYHDVFFQLDPVFIHTAEIIGIREINAMQMITRPNFKGTKKQIIDRFYTTLILFDLWNLMEVHQVSSKYRVNRGIIQKLMFSAASNSASILRFCEELPEFWAFRELLEKFTKRLTYCCSSELLPLMELPGIKIGRAKLLYQAGFQSVEDIANATAKTLVENVRNVSYKVAKTMISVAKLSLVEKIDMFQEKMQELMKIVGQ